MVLLYFHITMSLPLSLPSSISHSYFRVSTLQMIKAEMQRSCRVVSSQVGTRTQTCFLECTLPLNFSTVHFTGDTEALPSTKAFKNNPSHGHPGIQGFQACEGPFWLKEPWNKPLSLRGKLLFQEVCRPVQSQKKPGHHWQTREGKESEVFKGLSQSCPLSPFTQD